MVRTLVLALLVLLPTGCKKKSVDDFPDSGRSGDAGVPPGVDAGMPTPDAGPPLPSSGLITAAEGGALASEDGVFVLFVPAGALAADTEISIATLDGSEWPAETGGAMPLGGVYDIQPDGTTFSTPAFAIHRLPPRAPALLSPDGDPTFAFHYTRAADGTVEIVPTETWVFQAVSAVVGEINHLSAHWASQRAWLDGPTLTARVVAEAGRHAVDTEWFASHVSLQTAGSISMVDVSAASHVGTNAASYVIPVRHDGWSAATESSLDYTTFAPELPSRYRSTWSPMTTLPVIDAATPFQFPMPLPGWRCVSPADPGTSLIWISVSAAFRRPDSMSRGGVSLRTDIGTPDCIVRTEKPEYVAQRMMLGDARIMPIAVPADVTRDISMSMGRYGYLGTIPAGRTIRVCVTASMPTSVTYYPRYHPGYTFRDVPPPGCTEITNLDGVNPNDVLIVLEGAGSPNNVTVTTTQL